MPRPIHARIHAAALRANLERVRRSAPGARVWAVVKANAYGHGIDQVFDSLRSADGFALLDLAEAARLRELGWRGPILLLEGVFEPRDLDLCARLDLWHAVHCDEQIEMLAAQRSLAPQRVFLKMNSGMNRLGFAPERYRSAWARLAALAQVGEISLMTHFGDADGPRGIAQQLAAFDAAAQGLPGERTLCNSAAILRHAREARVRGDWVRAGVMLYGSAPDFPEHDAAHWGLQAAMTLSTRLIGVQQLQAGDAVGYGSRFRAEAPMHIGVAACGYADGYPRHCGSGTPVLVSGVRTRLVGRVSMDMLALDLTPLERQGVAAGFGAEVTLWGRATNGALLGIDEVARAAGSISWELMTALAARVPVTLDAGDQGLNFSA